ncbi:origin recognition complex, subunit 2 [Crepidotus variabilis]|uniref:Origin recognition complex subunit 2 n=1 Tax=Crepidotus variabilis TaxID=179855 RepID=A0A9P6E668_9AGAR|nr:origin recognition complex, subunit 2 [Crepidotus variabilis]
MKKTTTMNLRILLEKRRTMGTWRKKILVEGQSSNIIVQTAFDAYFTYNKPGRVQTSSNIFSDLLIPLSSEEYHQAFDQIKITQLSIQPSLLKADNLHSFFSRMTCELDEGFNILCYGLGSKRRLLNQFAREWCSKRGHVVVANGFQPDFSLKDLLNSIEDVPALQALDLPSTNIEKQARRIYDFFVSSKVHLYLVIHNLDSAPLRAQKSKSILSLLAHHRKIHITASIDHINAPLIWSSSEIFSRKPEVIEPGTTPSRGFTWLWHDLTTLQPYDFELAFADRSSLSGAHTGGARRKVDALAAQNVTAMSETAASHILASVTQKAQKLFVLVGNKQLEAIEGSDEGLGVGNLQQFGMGYDVLFSTARDNFIATNDTALRALLGEFRDHSLIVSAQAGAGSGEVLWIPMRKERLANVLRTLDPL